LGYFSNYKLSYFLKIYKGNYLAADIKGIDQAEIKVKS
jgi:hypothetical protein